MPTIVVCRYETGEPARSGDVSSSPRARGSAIVKFTGTFEAARSLSSTLGTALNLLQETCRRLFPSLSHQCSPSVGSFNTDEPTGTDMSCVTKNMSRIAR